MHLYRLCKYAVLPRGDDLNAKMPAKPLTSICTKSAMDEECIPCSVTPGFNRLESKFHIHELEKNEPGKLKSILSSFFELGKRIRSFEKQENLTSLSKKARVLIFEDKKLLIFLAHVLRINYFTFAK